MNVYDFDDTIYRGDSEIQFLAFVKERESFGKSKRRTRIADWLYHAGLMSLTRREEILFAFLPELTDWEQWVKAFWETHRGNVKDWYKTAHHSDDVVISASPDFLLEPICWELGISTLIATRMDPRTGKIEGKYNFAGEKPKRFREVFGNSVPDRFYSDSRTDAPMAKIAKKAWRVDGTFLTDWPFEKTGWR